MSMPREAAQPPPIQSKSRLPRWEIPLTDFGLFLALTLSCMVVFSGGLGKLATFLVPVPEEGDAPMLVQLFANLGMQAGMAAAFFGAHFLSPYFRGHPARVPASNSIAIGAKWLLITYVATAGVALVWRSSLNALGYEQVLQDPVTMAREGGTLIERTMIYTMIVLVAPICEELIFRGAIFRYLNKRVPLAVALSVSALLFALIHFNLYSLAPLFTVGLGLAVAYREAGSLIAPIVLHLGFNTLNLLLILNFPDIQ